MGLVVGIERWPMPVAINMATDGITTKPIEGVSVKSGSDSDLEIGRRLDGAKVLSAVDAMDAHLSDWSYFAYASPGWNNQGNRRRLVESVAADWVFEMLRQGHLIQRRTYDKVLPLIPFIAGGVAIELSEGARTEMVRSEIWYLPAVSRSTLIEVLVEYDCEHKKVNSESFKKRRKRYYQNNWERWQGHVDVIRTVLMGYDQAAQKSFKKHLI